MTAVAGTTPTIGQALRRWRFWAVTLGVLVVVSVGSLLLSAVSTAAGVLDAGSAAQTGGRALAEVLRQQGVDVRTVDRLADATSSPSGTLLVVDEDDLLSAADWRRLARSHDRLVVIAPGFTALSTVLPSARAAGTPATRVVEAGCDLALAERAGTMSLRDADRSLRDPSSTVCFGGQLVTARQEGVRIVLLADAQPFTNAHIVEQGNAAVALNVLGAESELTWYRPDPRQLAGGKQTLAELTPPWVTPVIALLLLTGVVVAFQRGRRLGPVVIERLPVTVRSRETVEGRARLYQRGGARLRAADSLRLGAIGRMAPMLGLGRSATVDQVATAAATQTGGRPDALRELLVDRVPADDRDLLALSDDLARLEAALKAATVPGPPAPRDGDR